MAQLRRAASEKKESSRVLGLDLDDECFAGGSLMPLMVVGIGSIVPDGRTVVTRVRMAEALGRFQERRRSNTKQPFLFHSLGENPSLVNPWLLWQYGFFVRQGTVVVWGNFIDGGWGN